MAGLASLSLVASTLTVLQVAQVSVAPPAAAADLSAGSVTTLAGSGANTTAAGTGATASFATPTAIAYSGGFAYVGDTDAIAKVATATGVSTVLTTAATGAQSIATDGTSVFSIIYNTHSVSKTVISTGVTTSLTALTGVLNELTLAADGYLYETSGNVVYKQSPSTGVVSTVATLGASETLYGLTSDGAGGVFVIGYDSSTSITRIAKVVIATGVTTTLTTGPGLPYQAGSSLFYLGGYLSRVGRAI